PAAFSEAIMGRLFFRRMFVVSTRVMQRSTASEGAMAHTINVAVQLSVPSETVWVMVWQPRLKQLVATGAVLNSLVPSRHTTCSGSFSASVEPYPSRTTQAL